jgi:regulator of sigma E protease
VRHWEAVNLLLALLGIIALIVLHELGHFAVAKAVGMRVERFSLFFPPTIAKIKRGDTEYAIGAIPAGGYVKITGMNPEELADMDPETTRRAYYAQPPWKRIAVILAGPVVNILIAFVLFWAVLMSGSLHGAVALENLDPHVTTLGAAAVASVEPGKPAAGVLQRGDRIVGIEGRRASLEEVVKQIGAHPCAGAPGGPRAGCRAATPVHLTVLRNGREVSLTAYPAYDAREKRMLLGFRFAPTVKSFGVLAAAGAAVSEMWHTTTGTLTHYLNALESSHARKELHSIVGISQVGEETVAAGAGYAFVFLGFLSLVLAIVNLFPFLPLDGGHVLWSLAEKVRGKRVSLLAMYRFSSVGIVLLLFLVINGVSNDISRLAG